MKKIKNVCMKPMDNVCMKLWDEMCMHPKFDSNGQCEICGYKCVDHEWKNGQCEVCGYECPHDDYEHECLDCGMECHEFLNYDND